MVQDLNKPLLMNMAHEENHDLCCLFVNHHLLYYMYFVLH